MQGRYRPPVTVLLLVLVGLALAGYLSVRSPALESRLPGVAAALKSLRPLDQIPPPETGGGHPAAEARTPEPEAVTVRGQIDQPVASPFLTPTVGPLGATVDAARRQRRNGDLAAALPLYRQAVAEGITAPEVLLELAQVELDGGETAAARERLQRLLRAEPGEPLRGRAALLLAKADLASEKPESALQRLDVQAAPDGLADLVVLLRAEAALQSGNFKGAGNELSRPELRHSTNRLFLEKGGQLAERIGDPDLAGELYARGATYPAWAADRSWLMKVAGDSFAWAGNLDRAIEQYRALIEAYSWTRVAARAGSELERLGGLTHYHRGLLAVAAGDNEAAREAFVEAVAEGTYAAAAERQLSQLEERIAWAEAVDVGSSESFRSFRSRYPRGSFAAEAWFREGFSHYGAGDLESALGVWDRGAAECGGDDRARLDFWAGKALAQLGRDGESLARLRAAAETRPAGYYALRARDLLAGAQGWPGWSGGRTADRDAERAEAQRWLASWAGPAAALDVAADARVRRGLGLLALGLRAEASAELDGLIGESQNAHFLFQLAQLLTEQELWPAAAEAATRLIALSPAKSAAEAPSFVRRLAYPLAYPDLVYAQAERQGVDPLLLLALIHQESAYDPFALSGAGARGLTQVMPETGSDIAAALGWDDFVSDDLYRPAVAVKFGAAYLAGQMARLGGDPFRAVAAYNAGAGPIPRWSASDPDLFVERIDYAETRTFVRQLYLHHAIYRSLLGR